MTRRALATLATLAALAAAAACADLIAPSRGGSLRYDWRLIVPYDSLGPREDTLSFHWPRNRLPVRFWVENQHNMPARIRAGIAAWEQVFLYGEWTGTLIADSTRADVIVVTTSPPPQTLPSAGRLYGNPFVVLCDGATDVDTAATRFQLALPIRLYVHPTDPNLPGTGDCLDRVAAHEVGHALGIFRHSADTLDLMYSFPRVSVPSRRDRATAENAYHFRAEMVPAPR